MGSIVVFDLKGAESQKHMFFLEINEEQDADRKAHHSGAQPTLKNSMIPSFVVQGK